MLLGTQNLEFPRQYLNTLPADDLNRLYYERGVKYESPTNFWGVLSNYFNIHKRINTLANFYPYHRTIQATKSEYYGYFCYFNLIMNMSFIVTGTMHYKQRES